MSTGSLEERLRLCFDTYDLSHTGYLDRKEVANMVASAFWGKYLVWDDEPFKPSPEASPDGDVGLCDDEWASSCDDDPDSPMHWHQLCSALSPDESERLEEEQEPLLPVDPESPLELISSGREAGLDTAEGPRPGSAPESGRHAAAGADASVAPPPGAVPGRGADPGPGPGPCPGPSPVESPPASAPGSAPGSAAPSLGSIQPSFLWAPDGNASTTSQALAQQYADRVFQQLDLDGDNRISFTEFCHMCRANPTLALAFEANKPLQKRLWGPALNRPQMSRGARCELCGARWGLLKEGRHCRQCGAQVCAKCSTGRRKLPLLGYKKAVRVCDKCVNMKWPAVVPLAMP